MHVRVAAKVDIFVTGDKDLLDVADGVTGLTITDPRGFWNLAEKRQENKCFFLRVRRIGRKDSPFSCTCRGRAFGG